MIHPTPQEMMTACASQAVDVARSEFSITLDYTFASLELLERIVDAQYRAFTSGWRRWFPSMPSEREKEKISQMWGTYLGEVKRLRHGGDWIVPDSGPYKGLVILQRGGGSFSPASKVHKRLTNGAEDNLSA